MKICYLCADLGVPILGRKGCSTHVRETTRALQHDGHDVFIITPNPGEDDNGNQDIEIVPIKPYRQKWMGSDVRHHLLNRRIVQKAAIEFEQRRPDVIYERYSLYSTAGETLAQRFSLPRILEVNSFLVHEQRTRLHFPRIAEWVEKRILRRAPFVIVVSAPLREAFIDLGIDPDYITIMPMAVDINRFHPGVEAIDLRQRFDIPENVTTVGYIGTLTAWHGINLLLKVAHQLKQRKLPITIVVVGGDEEKAEQNAEKVRADGIDGYIRFIGSIPYQEVPSILSALDITLIPGSHLWASPTKLFEYQAMGKPTIAPRLIPIEEAMTHDVDGLLFQSGNVEEMTEHIIALHENPDRRRKMGNEARTRVIKTHAWENNTERIIEIFTAMIEENKTDETLA